MKKISLLLILIISITVFYNCGNSKRIDSIVLQGKIINPIEENLVLKNNFEEAIDTLSLIDGTFQDTITVPVSYTHLTLPTILLV